MHANIYSLSIDDVSRLLRVGEGFVVGGGVHELVLAGRAGVLAPEALEVDGTHVTSASLEAEYSVDLLEVLESGFVIEAIAAAQSTGSDIVFTGR
jgi:hypothetical protein